MDQLHGEIRVNLLAQALDVYIHRVRVALVIHPDALLDHFAAQNLSLMGGERLQQLVLARGEIHPAAGAGHGARGCIHLQVGHADEPALMDPVSPRQGLHASQQLAEVERLAEIVVGAGLQAAHPVAHGVACREHQDRRSHPALA